MYIILLMISIVLFILTLPGTIEMTMLTLANLLIRNKKEKIIDGNIKLAVLIPAHNEEKHIKRCIDSLKNCNTKYDYEIIVIADNCSDKTVEISMAQNIKVLERENKVDKGKGFALKYAFDKFKDNDYEAYIIVDADTIVKKNFIDVIGTLFLKGEESVQCTYLVHKPESTNKTKMMNLALLSMNAFRPLGRKKLGLSCGIFGNGFGLSKKLLEKIPYNANSITEDMEFHIEIVRNKKKVLFTSETQVLADFPLTQEGNDSQRARWEGGRFYLQKKYAPYLLKEICKGNIKLTEVLMELMTLPLAYQMSLLIIMLFADRSFYYYYSLFSIIIIFIHIILAALFIGKAKDLLILLQVPKYIFWKIIKLPFILSHANKDAKWVRTKRDKL